MISSPILTSSFTTFLWNISSLNSEFPKCYKFWSFIANPQLWNAFGIFSNLNLNTFILVLNLNRNIILKLFDVQTLYWLVLKINQSFKLAIFYRKQVNWQLHFVLHLNYNFINIRNSEFLVWTLSWNSTELICCCITLFRVVFISI